MRSHSAEAQRHHELWQDPWGCAGAEEHRATGSVSCQQRCSIPEGDQPEGAFTQNCKQEDVLHHCNITDQQSGFYILMKLLHSFYKSQNK